MKLNGLTNNLKDNDKTLSNSYLQHIVELLRQEVETLAAKEAETETTLNDHIETQIEHVDTKIVNASESVNTPVLNADEANITELNVSKINDKIHFLQDAINVVNTRLEYNGHEVVTDAAFTGPFVYRGTVTELPASSQAGDVYVMDGTVYISDGSTYASFDMPLGTVSREEYDNEVAAIEDALTIHNTAINELNETVSQTADNLTIYETTTDERLDAIEPALANKLDKNPEDDETYVRKNDEWVPLSDAANTVQHTVIVSEATEEEPEVDSIIDNSVDGVTIDSPHVNINTDDFRLNGGPIPQVNKFGLSKENVDPVSERVWYEYKYDIDPDIAKWPDSTRTLNSPYYGYNGVIRTLPCSQILTTRDYTYAWWPSIGINAVSLLHSIDKNGKMKMLQTSTMAHQYASMTRDRQGMVALDPDYCPEGMENKMYIVLPLPYLAPTHASSHPRFENSLEVYEYDNGDLANVYKRVVPTSEMDFTQASLGINNFHGGGKFLRRKDAQRMCYISPTSSTGGRQCFIIGCDRDSDPSDPFDPSKSILVQLPVEAPFCACNLLATDKAWYVLEDNTGRLMKILPNGSVSEIVLSAATFRAAFGNGIEYIDKNGKPAVGIYTFVASSGGKVEILFIEENDDNTTNITERALSYTYGGWSGNFRFMENDYYIFYTAAYGWSSGATSSTGSTSEETDVNKRKLTYFDKQTLTLHTIDDFDANTGKMGSGGARIDMAKTKGDSIWFIPYYNFADSTSTPATGVLKYVTNTDYTNIVDGVDTGSIEVQTVLNGPNKIGLFGYFGAVSYPISAQDPRGLPSTLHGVNDDGYLIVFSGDFSNFAICYGDGVVQTYYNDNRWSGLLQMTSESESTYSVTTQGRKHGWTVLYGDTNNHCLYVSPYYTSDGEMTMDTPRLQYAQTLQQVDKYSSYYLYLNYGIMFTYEDYKKRSKLERDNFVEYSLKNNYTSGTTFTYYTQASSHFKEIKNGASEKLNLTYDGHIISSVEI